ncbi:MAG: dihydropteroate synthase [Candidatus Omnitrophica bacterium]|nr:dihydropteroate synthase [Candidatus Omnitrophota bacterium]
METRILKIESQNEAIREIRKVGACPGGVKFMSPKAVSLAVKIKELKSAACNIMKQEMLSLGGEVAVSRDAVTNKVNKSDCLIFGNLSQIKKLCFKLNKQPFGLTEISGKLKEALCNYQKDTFKLICGKYRLYPGRRVYLMGILNVTPDSFSDGGLFFNPRKAVERGLEMAGEGADIIDVGGESTRPGAKPVTPRQQIKRVVPVIKSLSKRLKVPVSIDTSSRQVALAALEAGAAIINDISGLKKDGAIAELAVRFKAGLVLTHSKGTPRTMQKKPEYKCLMQDIINGLAESVNRALGAGVVKEQIVIDPGVGFGKTTEHNLKILKNLSELKGLGFPIMVGTSRKSLIGNILKVPVGQRLLGTAATVTYSIMQGAHIVRVHDVKQIKQVIVMTESIKRA